MFSDFGRIGVVCLLGYLMRGFNRRLCVMRRYIVVYDSKKDTSKPMGEIIYFFLFLSHGLYTFLFVCIY